MKRILGLDLSSVNSGYSIFGPRLVDGEDPISLYNTALDLPEDDLFLITYGNITPNKKLNQQAKLELIYNLIDELIVTYGITVVAIEDSHFRANAATLKLLARISGVAMLSAQKHGCEIYLYPALTIKKSFTGSGKSTKAEMIQTAIDRFSLDAGSIDDNAADAIGVASTYIIKELRRENL